MSIYTHQGWLGFVPHGHVERNQERFEQQLAWEETQHVERCDLGEADEAAAGVVLRHGGMGEVDLGGILAQPYRDLQ